MSTEEEAESAPPEEEAQEKTPEAESQPPTPVERKAEAEEELGEEVAVLTIPLGEVWAGARTDRTPKAVRVLRRAAIRHLKPEDKSNVKLSPELNRLLWSWGGRSPPRKVRVRVFKDDDGVYTLRPVEGA